MRTWLTALSAVVGLLIAAPQSAWAFTSTGNSSTVTVDGTVAESTTFSSSIVQQGSADVPATLGFGSGGNGFRDSGEAIKVTVDTNVANNRLIIYTNNLGASASPKACLDTSKGNDGGGLVGKTDCTKTVPLLWAINDTNVDHNFTTGTVGDDEIYITDLAHAATFTPKNSAVDNQQMKFCASGTAQPNTTGDGLYPQFFGGVGVDKDLCDAVSGSKIAAAEELSKNIAVFAFGFSGTTGLAPNLSTPSPSDTISVTSPVYLAVGADFTGASPQDYGTNSLTVELIAQ